VNPLEFKGSKGELLLAVQIHQAGLPEPEREYRFAARSLGLGPGIRERLRRAGLKDWRFDFAWPEHRLAVEVEGGSWSKGRHVRGTGFEEDCEKYNAASFDEWAVLRFTTAMVRDGRALATIKRALAAPELAFCSGRIV